MALDAFLYFTGAATSPSGEILPVGESQDPQFKNLIEVSSFSFGVDNATTVGSGTSGAGAGKAKLNEFTFTKKVDNASRDLFLASGFGSHFPNISLVVRHPGTTQAYLRYDFALVIVTKIQWTGGGSEIPQEEVTLAYGALQIRYSKQNSTGGLGAAQTGAWSQITNTATLDVGTGVPLLGQ